MTFVHSHSFKYHLPCLIIALPSQLIDLPLKATGLPYVLYNHFVHTAKVLHVLLSEQISLHYLKIILFFNHYVKEHRIVVSNATFIHRQTNNEISNE